MIVVVVAAEFIVLPSEIAGTDWVRVLSINLPRGYGLGKIYFLYLTRLLPTGRAWVIRLGKG